MLNNKYENEICLKTLKELPFSTTSYYDRIEDVFSNRMMENVSIDISKICRLIGLKGAVWASGVLLKPTLMKFNLESLEYLFKKYLDEKQRDTETLDCINLVRRYLMDKNHDENKMILEAGRTSKLLNRNISKMQPSHEKSIKEALYHLERCVIESGNTFLTEYYTSMDKLISIYVVEDEADDLETILIASFTK
ncbi:MAG: hypothetical protein WC783_00370 [Candidatus Paceibacterota bacterium]